MPAGSLGLWLFLSSFVSNLLALALPLALLQVYDRILPTAQYGTAFSLFLVVVIAMVLDGFLRLVRVRAAARLSIVHEHGETVGLARDLLRADVAQLQSLDAGARRDGFDAITRARDLGGIAVRLPLFDMPFAVIFIGLLAFIGGWLAIVPVIVLVPFSIVALRVSHLQRSSALARAHASQATMSRLADLFAGFVDAKSFGYAGRLMNGIDRAMRDHAEESERHDRRSSLLADLSQVASLAATVGITVWGALLVIDTSFTTGGLAACSILGGRAVGAALGLFSSIARFGAAQAASDQVTEVRRVLQVPSSTSDGSAVADGARDLELDGMALRRPGAETVPVHARIAAGATVLLRGGHQASQVLLMLAIAGLERPDAGTVRPRLAAAFVPDRPTMFRGSILDNLTGWDPSRTEAARACARELGLSPLIDRLPDGIRSEIGVGLVSELSAGIVKRIGLVRALVSGAPLIMLHNPEVDLDVDGRRRLARLLGARGERSTLLLCTADPALAAIADQTLDLSLMSERESVAA